MRKGLPPNSPAYRSRLSRAGGARRDPDALVRAGKGLHRVTARRTRRTPPLSGVSRGLLVVVVLLVVAGCGGGGGDDDLTLTEGSISPGQVYAARDEEGGPCHVLKVLSADGSTVVVRRYANVFDECPTDVPDDLRLGITVEDLQSGDVGVGFGAVAIDKTGFAADAQQYTFLGERPVTDEERANVEEALS